MHPQRVLTSSRKVDECTPLDAGKYDDARGGSWRGVELDADSW
jgi:hypothetical protein